MFKKTFFDYISCLQLKKVKYCVHVAHEAMQNNHLFNHTAYYHLFQQVIAFLVIVLIKYIILHNCYFLTIISNTFFNFYAQRVQWL